jgi:hypothetical protein
MKIDAIAVIVTPITRRDASSSTTTMTMPATMSRCRKNPERPMMPSRSRIR